MTHSLNSYGELVDSCFHDGLLTGIKVDDGLATLSLRTVEGARYELALTGVTHLQANEFRQGNIVDMLEVFRGQDVDPEHLRPLFWGDLPDETLKTSLERGEVWLVNLTTSYGCDLMALCRDFTVNPVEASQAQIR